MRKVETLDYGAKGHQSGATIRHLIQHGADFSGAGLQLLLGNQPTHEERDLVHFVANQLQAQLTPARRK